VANEAEQNRTEALSDPEYILLVSLYQQMLDFTRTLITAVDIEEHSELTASLLRQLDVQSSSASKGLSEFLREKLEIFLDDSRWQKLAVRPSEFDVAMRQALDFVRGFLRAKHGIAAHRPTRKALRDTRIGILCVRGRRFLEISERMGISSSAAHRAYERQEERAYRFFESCLKLLELSCRAEPRLAREPGRQIVDLMASFLLQ
jgi:hypothetical protein